ncbi:MAG: glycosyltransferase [Bacilli bacterium]|nr:glycosyltransferase [Bacilli bacterium]
MKKLKVGMFMDSWYPDINGVILVMENLMKNMSKYADITLVVPKTGSEDNDKNYPFKVIRVDSIPVFNTSYKLGMVDLEYFKYKKIFENLDFDIIHIHSPFALGRLGIRVAKDKKIPVIGTMHTRWEFEFKKYLKSNIMATVAVKYLIRSYNKCYSCIALNNALMDVYSDYGYKGTFKLIRNGTDLDTIENKDKAIDKINEMFKLDKKEPVFLFVGRIISIKNIFFILDVLKKLKESKFKYKMIYVGDGPDYDKLKKKVKEYKMSNDVILTGRIMDRELLKAIYSRADLFIFPSLFDSSSLVQIEAASQETPTIFVEGSVTSDTVDNNVNGFKEKEDVELFAERIKNIINDKELYNSVKKAAKKDLAMSWRDISKETYNYYIEVIDEYNKKNTNN